MMMVLHCFLSGSLSCRGLSLAAPGAWVQLSVQHPKKSNALDPPEKVNNKWTPLQSTMLIRGGGGADVDSCLFCCCVMVRYFGNSSRGKIHSLKVEVSQRMVEDFGEN